MKRSVVVAVLAALIPFSPLAAQQAGTPKKVDAGPSEIERLRAELAACKAAAGKAPSGQVSAALASLRAVQSALKTGANLDEFKKYQIEAQIKVDQLPVTNATRGVREVAQLYQDAVHMALLKFDGTVSEARVSAFFERYKAEPELLKIAEGLKATDDEDSLTAKLNKVRGEYTAQGLLLLADQHLAKLPSPAPKE